MLKFKFIRGIFMPNIRELSFDEIALVSGGNANSNYEGGGSRSRNTGARNSLGRNAPTHIYSDPSTVNCANNVFGGMIGGISKGPGGMALGVASGALKGNCLGSSNNNSGNNRGCNSSSSNCSHGNAASTCNR
ncbi:TPA: hypothetical protein ACGTMM_004968 [Escherichia coli]|uniref:hypothetical protein n=1 Tax=Escherichia coli TaxID=562 RepID=UPI0002CA1AE1|nr:hypothetical protein [Escherichia coli]ENC42844.1 hypothetical protein ECP02999172_5156 [Escherichia coli P0299917.2]